MKTRLQIAVLPFFCACGTLSASHPLEPGDHQLGVTFGGPFTTSLGPPIPVPNLIAEGRTGLEPGRLPEPTGPQQAATRLAVLDSVPTCG